MPDMLDTIILSKQRRAVLRLLSEAPRTLGDIKLSTGTSSPAIIPQIRKLEEVGLVVKEDDAYRLTEIGRIVTRYMGQFLDTVDLIEQCKDFWTGHVLEGIPEPFRDRIIELMECKIVESDPSEVFEPHKEFMKNLLKAKTIKGVSPIFHPEYPKAFLKLAENGVGISLILNRVVLSRISKENQEILKKGLELENTGLYVTDDDIGAAFTVTDHFLSLGLFSTSGKYDVHHDLVSYSPSALKWGNDLFRYYRERAQEVADLKSL